MPDREEYHRLMRQLPEPKVTCELVIRLHADGAMSVAGPVADKEFCRKLLEEAWASINRQTRPGGLVVPGCDVDSRAKEAYVG